MRMGRFLSAASRQPGVEDPDRVIETMGAADPNERLTAGDHARPGQGIVRSDGKLRLRQREEGLGAKPGMPAGRRRFEPQWLLVKRQQQQR